MVVEYPALEDPATSAFLNDPLAVIAACCAALARDGDPVARVIVLTTYADRLEPVLRAAGYLVQPIDMPAGPGPHRRLDPRFPETGAGRTLYLEAVNEADEKIRPGFALTMRDASGRLRWGPADRCMPATDGFTPIWRR